MAAAAVELEAKKAMGIDADADSALGEAGTDLADEALGPFLAVVLAAAGGRAEVTVQEIVAAEQRPAGRFGVAQRRPEGEGGEQGAAWSVGGADHEGLRGMIRECGRRVDPRSCKGVLGGDLHCLYRPFRG